MQYILFGLIVIAILLAAKSYFKKKPPVAEIPVTKIHELLAAHIHFYNSLDAAQQAAFRTRIQHFLDNVAISAVGDVKISDLDRLYVAASAIIPIFYYPDWAYDNLDEVLLYAGAFTQDFSGRQEDKNVLGMVGNGAMNRMMILSVQALRNGFEQDGTGNTGIHEFVHLLDKADGATDGVPEAMIPKELIEPWVRYMHEAIAAIRTGESEFNPYAAKSEAEFFAVISEYFFQNPARLKEHHPELEIILENIYRKKTDAASL